MPPRIEDDLFPGVIWPNSGHNPIHRIIKQDGADAFGATELEVVCGGEERLVLADGLAFVVEDGPTASQPAGQRFVSRGGIWIQFQRGADLLLNFAAKTIGIAELALDVINEGEGIESGECALIAA